MCATHTCNLYAYLHTRPRNRKSCLRTPPKNFPPAHVCSYMMCESEILRGGTGKKQNWCLENPVFPVKKENAQNIKKGLLIRKISRNTCFRKIPPPPLTTPSTFFSDRLRGGNPPSPRPCMDQLCYIPCRAVGRFWLWINATNSRFSTLACCVWLKFCLTWSTSPLTCIHLQ